MVMIQEDEYENLLEYLHIAKDKVLMKKIKNLDNLEFDSFSSLKDLDNAI